MFVASIVIVLVSTVVGEGCLAQAALPPLGDFDRNGRANAADGAAYIKAFGIRFATYGVTDDIYNTGVRLPRRSSDWQVQRISDDNLPGFSITDPEVFPVILLPRFGEMMTLFPNVPQQYFRELGRRRVSLQFFGDMGRLAKTWGVTANGLVCQITFWHSEGGYDGRFRFWVSPNVWSPWEVLTDIRFDPSSGLVSFNRPLGPDYRHYREWQHYEGWVEAAGQEIRAGTFRQEGNCVVCDIRTYPWHADAQQPDGGTTEKSGEAEEPGEVVGNLPAHIQLNTGTLGETVVHEIGHTVWNRIAGGDLAFTPNDRDEMMRLFTENSTVYNRGGDSTGTGFWSSYAAHGAGEDFAETFKAYFVYRGLLEQRALTEPLLAAKLAFIRDRVDTPDPGPIAATQPGAAAGEHYVFMSRNVLRYRRGGEVQEFPDVSISRVQPAIAETSSGLRVFAVGTNNRIYHRLVSTRGEFTGWQALPDSTRLPVGALYVAERGETYVFLVGNDHNVYYRVLDSVGSPGANGIVPGIQTSRAVSAARLGDRIYLFAVNNDNRAMFTTFSSLPTGAFSTWVEVPGSAHVRDLVFAKAINGGRTASIELLSLNGSFRIITQSLTVSSSAESLVPSAPSQSYWRPGWEEEVGQATVVTTPTLTADRWLYVKGFGDGQVYRKRLNANTGYELVNGL